MTIDITVRLYGRYRDAAGSETITLQLQKGESIHEVLDAFVKKFPAFSKDTRHMMVSKNGVLSAHDALLQQSDLVAIAPPVVSGG
jgi:molybdopterin converting factor small subunit